MQHLTSPFSRININRITWLDNLVQWADKQHALTCKIYNDNLDDLDELLAQFPDLLTRGPSEDLTVEQLADRLALLTRARTLPCIPYSLRTTPGHIGNFDILRPIIPPDEVKRLDAICAALNGQYVLYHSAFTEKRDVLAGAGQYYLMTKLHSE